MKLKNILLCLLLNCFPLFCYALGVHDESALNFSVNYRQPVFVIKLKSNPTTGYSWSLNEYNKMLIANTKHQFVAPNTKLIGAPGFEEWTFKVQPTAFTNGKLLKIEFVYARPWEKSGDKSKVVFNVRVMKR